MKKLLVLLFLAMSIVPAHATQSVSSISIEDEASSWPATWNAFVDTILSQNSGTSRPAYAATGTIWYNTGDTSLYFYDGSADILIGKLDTANHQIMPPIGGGSTSLASASTVDIGSVAQGAITITGTNAITGFGSSMKAGQVKIISFSGALTLTHSGTLSLPGATNITTSAGDVAGIMCTATGYYKVVFYQPAAGIGLSVIPAKTGLVNTSPSANPPSATSLSDWFDAVFGTSHGKIIYRGSSEWTSLSPGTAGQVLQTQGSGSNPAWVDASGDVVFPTITLNNNASAIFTDIPSQYDHLEFDLTNVLPAAGNPDLWLVISINNGSSWISSGYYYALSAATSSGTAGLAPGSGAAGAKLYASVGSTSYTGVSGKVDFYGNGGVRYKQGTVSLQAWDSTTYKHISGGFSNNAVTANVNAISIYFNGTTMASGTITMRAKRK